MVGRNMRTIGGPSGIGAPLAPDRIGGDNWIRRIGDRLILDMHEGAGRTIRDLSGCGNDLILTGNENWQRGSFYFDGSSYFSISDILQVGLDMGLSSFMLEMRIRAGVLGTWRNLIDKYSPVSVRGYQFFIMPTSGRLWGFIEDSGGWVEGDDGDSITDGRWHHIAIVFDRSANMTRFLDGSVTGTVDNISGINGDLSSSARFAIGARWGNLLKLVGSIAEARIWNFGVGGLCIGPIGILQQYLYHKWSMN